MHIDRGSARIVSPEEFCANRRCVVVRRRVIATGRSSPGPDAAVASRIGLAGSNSRPDTAATVAAAQFPRDCCAAAEPDRAQGRGRGAIRAQRRNHLGRYRLPVERFQGALCGLDRQVGECCRSLCLGRQDHRALPQGRIYFVKGRCAGPAYPGRRDPASGDRRLPRPGQNPGCDHAAAARIRG